jgi:hypothetical protein
MPLSHNFLDISIPKFFAVICNVKLLFVNYPLNKLLWLDRLQKLQVFMFILADG